MAISSNIFKRYELKYLLSKEQYEQIKEVVVAHTNPDPFGNNDVYSLYFDTDSDVMIRRSLSKPKYKEKLRLRSYGIPDGKKEVFVELKKKYKGIVYKRRETMTYEQAKEYLCNKKKAPVESQITKEIDYVLSFYEGIHPNILILCNREAMYGVEDKDLRITFDHNICFRDDNLDMQDAAQGKPLLDEGQVLMEVKVANAMPLWLTRTLTKQKAYKTSFSKYGCAYQTVLQEKIS